MLAVASPSAAQPSSPAQMGMAWQVQGEWRGSDGHVPIHDGDAVEAGALLQPVGNAPDHAIAILLPDSQRIFYECFSPQDCARGFLVPKLIGAPDPFAVEMLERIRAVLTSGRAAAWTPPSLRRPVPRDTLMLALNSADHVGIGGLVQRLPNGHYVCYVQRVDAKDAEPIHLEVEKTTPMLPLTLPEEGIYEIRILDDRNVQRIDLVAAAETADRAAELAKPFNRAKALLKAWSETFHAWPVQDLLRAYLEALVLDIQPGHGTVVAASSAQRGVTASPQFSPRPGYQGDDMSVSLQSATEGATIHFMMGEAQPTESSPVYRAPIVVKGLGLMIKAFASAPGMKDSPVVTGTFLIHTNLGN